MFSWNNMSGQRYAHCKDNTGYENSAHGSDGDGVRVSFHKRPVNSVGRLGR